MKSRGAIATIGFILYKHLADFGDWHFQVSWMDRFNQMCAEYWINDFHVYGAHGELC